MGKIFYIMGKSSTGKDTIFQEILRKKELNLKNIVLYTTRPIREQEKDGVEYYFVDEEALEKFQREGRVIELRAYDTVHGVWKYFTVDSEKVDLNREDYLAIGTLESYQKLKDYYGGEKLVPLYIETSDNIRLERALNRERKQAEPKYEEMCRRFLADAADFSEEKIKEAGVEKRFSNDGEREICIEQVADYILECKSREF